MSGLERKALQVAVSIGCIVPLGAGAAGVLLGPRIMGGAMATSADLEGHFRYLSGLLLAIGLGYLSCVPSIEQRRGRFLLLTGLVVVGGLARLYSVFASGWGSQVNLMALGMEILVTPLLALWQWRVSAQDQR